MSNKPYKEDDLEHLLEQLTSVTHSPSGDFSAENSFKKLARHLPHRPFYRTILFKALSSAAAIALICLLTWNDVNSSVEITTIETLAETKSITLSDGTLIRLNRYSSLTFPESFNGEKRTVTLKGEAYFEVAKDAQHPFIVQTKEINVQVLGTHFNVDAYPNSPTTKTTLLEGSVKVFSPEKNIEVLLKPNECATYSRDNGLVCQSLGLQAKDETAWQSNALIFTETSIGEIMNELSHTFNTPIKVSDSKLKEYKLSARFEYHETLTEILNLLQSAGYFDYTVENNMIRIKAKSSTKTIH